MPKILRFEHLESGQFARELCNDIFEIAQSSDLKTDYKLKLNLEH